MNARIEALRAGLEEPLLVSNPLNVRYLTGFESSNAALLVEPERLRLYTDFRYVTKGRMLAGVELVETRRALLADLAERLSGRIGVEAAFLTYTGYETLAAGGLELVPHRGAVEALRAVKDDAELEAIRAASAITNDAFVALTSERFVGRTERELAWRLQSLFHELGAEGAAFPSIVAGGAGGATPHAETGSRVIEAGTTVVVDAGCMHAGYCSDCTRTFVTGSLPPRLAEAYAACLAGQQVGLDAVRPGVSGAAADAAARAVIEAAGFGEAFGHGLGHGVGLAVHEAPRLSPESEDVLASGNVVTVEPGIYLEELGGVRIEDLVVVGEHGAEILTPFTKEPVTVA
ncbi:MAG: aminopeptidase P family protein [Actinobacteria bacterium]|nr:aminopeptidase P family protein [Actinomycetota bacterium]